MDSTEGKEREEIEEALKEAGLGAKDLSVFLSGGAETAAIAARLAGFAMYRVTTPCVIHVAMLREKYLSEDGVPDAIA